MFETRICHCYWHIKKVKNVGSNKQGVGAGGARLGSGGTGSAVEGGNEEGSFSAEEDLGRGCSLGATRGRRCYPVSVGSVGNIRGDPDGLQFCRSHPTPFKILSLSDPLFSLLI